MEDKHLKTNIAQYALVICDKKMLILWPADEGPLWVLPGGRLNQDDDSYKKALIREVKEELGVEVIIKKPFYVDMYDVPGKKHRYVVFFLCDLMEGYEIKLSKEHVKFEWLAYSDLMSNLEKDPERARPGIILLKRLKEEGLL